jgi:hypothetical protein
MSDQPSDPTNMDSKHSEAQCIASQLRCIADALRKPEFQAAGWATDLDAAAVELERLSRADKDSERLDWLERNLIHLTHDRATGSVDMSGRNVRGQLVNESRGAGAGPSYFKVNHRSIREGIDAAIGGRGLLK